MSLKDFLTNKKYIFYLGNWVFNKDSNIRTPVNNRSESASNNNSSESLGIDEEIAHAITPDSPEVRKGVRAFFSRIFNRNLQPAELPSVPHNEPWTSPPQIKNIFFICERDSDNLKNTTSLVLKLKESINLDIIVSKN